MQKHCDVSSLTMRWFKSNIAMFQIEHRNVFCLLIICQKTVLRATVLHFLSIFGVLRRFCVILEYNLYPFIIRTLGGLSDFEVTNCQPFLLLHSALICFLGISSMLQR